MNWIQLDLFWISANIILLLKDFERWIKIEHLTSWFLPTSYSIIMK